MFWVYLNFFFYSRTKRIKSVSWESIDFIRFRFLLISASFWQKWMKAMCCEPCQDIPAYFVMQGEKLTSVEGLGSYNLQALKIVLLFSFISISSDLLSHLSQLLLRVTTSTCVRFNNFFQMSLFQKKNLWGILAQWALFLELLSYIQKCSYHFWLLLDN